MSPFDTSSIGFVAWHHQSEMNPPIWPGDSIPDHYTHPCLEAVEAFSS